MMIINRLKSHQVHCHVGSLESATHYDRGRVKVHCHVGSLEMPNIQLHHMQHVHCHVGSLEKD